MAEVKNYTVEVTRGERYWLVRVPEIGYTTQARHLRELDDMARDLIAGVTGEPADSFELSTNIVMPEAVASQLRQAAELREASRRSQAEAAEVVRAAARELKASGMPLRDIGALLGVSYQRAGQLVH